MKEDVRFYRTLTFCWIVLLAISLIILCSSCSVLHKTPQQKLNKLLKEHPELATKDTTKQHTEGKVNLTPANPDSIKHATQAIETAINSVKPVGHGKNCDSILYAYQQRLNTALSKSRQDIKHYEDRRQQIPDTTFTNKGIKVHLWQEDNKLKWNIEAPVQITNVKPPVINEGVSWVWILATAFTSIIAILMFLLWMRR